ncbi:MFS transporter [Nioella sp.]|uniref:MFS transporter n=1 Tax=Nioella sp. TaxID=1912091 RepID=UPI003B517CB3
MLEILADRTYRRLFLAQAVALLGTGLATVALGLLAYDLAGDGAAMVLGTVFTIKMVAYVGIAPIAGAFADHVNRRALLVGLDLVRAGAALFLPFVTEVWQVYVLIFLLQSASAAFTPTFQVTIPDVLPEEARYTRALSLSRLAYDLENIVSPTLAALLLAVMSYNSLFFGTVALFAAQFALSHACCFVTYPLSGWLMTQFGPVTALGCLAALAGAVALTVLCLWRKEDPEILEHTHENLPLDPPHLEGARRHAHPVVVDDQHPR